MTGLDSTLAREQEISIVSECDVEVCILKKSRDRFRYQPQRFACYTSHNIHLTFLEGDPVGYLVGQPVGCLVGQPVGYLVGQLVGCFVGGLTGLPVGE